MKIKQVIREHRSIAILFGFELLVLIWAFCLLFGERTVIDINPENADYFNSCTINDGKLQINFLVFVVCFFFVWVFIFV